MPTLFRPQLLLAGAGLGLLLVVLAFSARTGSSQPLQPSGFAHAGSTYVEAMVGTPHFVNPLLASSDTDTDLAHLVYSGLTRVTVTGTLAPDLAQGWDVSPDGRTYTFTLASNLRWHDGEPVTSADVLFTLDTLRKPDFPGDPALALPWKDVDIKAPSSQTVLFHLPAADASFLQYTTLGLLPQHAWGAIKSGELLTSGLNQAPIGSGPWRYVRGSSLPSATAASSDAGLTTPVPSAQSGGGVMLEPNPYAATAPHAITRIWFRAYPTFGAALFGFRAGEVHGMGHIPAEHQAEVASVPGVDLHHQTLARYTMLILNVRSPLFDQAQTRQAVALAIDRNSLIQSSLGGQAEPLASPLLPHSWAFDPSADKPRYDPARARQLLDAAGWIAGSDGVRVRSGVSLTLVLASNVDAPSNAAMSQKIKDYLGAVGIDVKLAPVSRDTLVRDYLAPHAFHMVLAGWEAQGADPDVAPYWHSASTASGGLNFSGWSNPDADKGLDTARNALDPKTRTAGYLAFASAFAADVPSVILAQPRYLYATRMPAANVTLPNTDLLGPFARFDTIADWSLKPAQLP